MNPFESGERKAIPAVLVYARQGGRVLMIHRNGRAGDYHSGKWNGLGGKLELDESPREAARREFLEEAGADLPEERFRMLGTLTFPNFKPHKGEDWLVYVYGVELSDASAASIGPRNDEGELHWVPFEDLGKLNLWAGDRYFIPFVAEGHPFAGTIWYMGEHVTRYQVDPIGSPA